MKNWIHSLPPLGLAALLFTLTACVTVNIYFPAAEAEAAARTIVREVLHEESLPSDIEPQSASPAHWKMALLNFIVPAAAAAEQPNIKIDTPAIRKLRLSMRSRSIALQPFFRKGAVGFLSNGMIGVRDLSVVQLRLKNKAKQLVSAENKDRTALYREIARGNGYPERQARIQSIFAKVWADEAPSGYWVQSIDGTWKQK